jgi:hypothetical protein
VVSADTTFELSWNDGATPHAIVLTDSQHQQQNGGNNTAAAAPAHSHVVVVKNTGQRTGDEVVFAFFTPPDTVPEHIRPMRQLYGFQRVADLAPGRSARVGFPVQLERVSLGDDAGTRRVYAGEYRLQFSNGVMAEEEGAARFGQGSATELRGVSVHVTHGEVLSVLPEGTGAL